MTTRQPVRRPTSGAPVRRTSLAEVMIKNGYRYRMPRLVEALLAAGVVTPLATLLAWHLKAPMLPSAAAVYVTVFLLMILPASRSSRRRRRRSR